MDNIEKQKYISNLIHSQIDIDLRQRQAAAKRQAYEASDEYQEQLAKSHVIQNEALNKTKQNDQSYALLCEEQAQLYNKIVTKLKLDSNPTRDIPVEEIIDVLLKYEDDLARIETLSAQLKKPGGDITKGSPYERMFTDLVKLNPRFAYFAPRFAVNRADIKFANLPKDELNGDMLGTLERLDLMRDATFRKYHIHLFSKYIHTISDLETAKKALRLYPEQYPNLNSIIKLLLDQDVVLVDLFKNIPTTGRYMTQRELFAIAKAAPSLFAKKIILYPEILDVLDNNFFKKFSISTMFQEVSKKKLIEHCSQYFSKHTILRDYAYSNNSQQHIHSQAKYIKEFRPEAQNQL